MLSAFFGAFDAITEFFFNAFAMLAAMPPLQLVIFLWPFLLLELPRHLLSEVWYLLTFTSQEEESRKRHFVEQLAAEPPLISVLLPGYNEEETLETTVLALREQSYPNMEIIVVNDGSTDGMGEVAEKMARKGWIRYFHHVMRGGKSSAANFAMLAARGEYLVICDADSTFDTDAVWHLMAEFYRPEVWAVAGNIRVRNAFTNLLTRCQALQYTMSIGYGRRVLASLGMLSIVSGAFGALRRSVMLTTYGGDPGPGEDADVTLKTRILGGDIAFAPKAVCLTDAPDTWWAYYRQQLRWNRDTVKLTLLKFPWFLNPFNHRFSVGNLLAALDIIIFQILFALVFPIYLVWLYAVHGEIFWQVVAIVLLLYTVFNYIQYLIMLTLSERVRTDLRMLPYVPLYGLFLGVYLRLVRLIAYIDELVLRSSYRDNYVPSYVRHESAKDPW